MYPKYCKSGWTKRRYICKSLHFWHWVDSQKPLLDLPDIDGTFYASFRYTGGRKRGYGKGEVRIKVTPRGGYTRRDLLKISGTAAI